MEKILIDYKSSKATYNVGFGKSYSNSEVLDLFNSLTTRPVEVVTQNRARSNDIMECIAETTKVREAFSWDPCYTLSEGLTEMIQAMENDINSCASLQ